jgi:hypothetical protein
MMKSAMMAESFSTNAGPISVWCWAAIRWTDSATVSSARFQASMRSAAKAFSVLVDAR